MWLINKKKKMNKNPKNVWSTKRVNKVLHALEHGGESESGCFYMNDSELRAPNLTFELTSYEKKEFIKCANDVIYFADKYGFAMTDDGVENIKLRPYQRKMMKSFQNERNVILLAARQVGKCQLFNSKITILDNDKEKQVSIGWLYFTLLKKQRKLTIFEKLKFSLWKIYDKL